MRLFLSVLIGRLVRSATPTWAFGLAKVPLAGRQVRYRCPRLGIPSPVCHAVHNDANGDDDDDTIADLRKKLAAKDDELAAKDDDFAAKLAAKDDDFAAKLAAKDDELAAKDDELAMKDQLLASALPSSDSGKKVTNELLPFDVSHIHTIELDNTWTDVSKGMGFVGRADFSKEIADTLRRIIDEPPSQPKESTSLVYSTVSGSGKTVSMLHLKTNLPPRLPDVSSSNIVVAYLGFNVNLELGDEELKHIDAEGKWGANQVLARRLLGSVLLSKKYPDAVSLLPMYEQLYKGRGFPTVDQSLEMLLEELGASPDNRIYIVAGVDEVQRLNAHEQTFEGAELGRYFLRTLRRWQCEWNKHGLTVLGLGTGVTLDFYEQPTIGSNEALSGGDAVLINKEDFKSLAETAVDEAKKNYETKFLADFGHDADRETLIAWIAAAFWPRVRVLEYLKNGSLNVVPMIADPNEEKWPIWLTKWMRGEKMLVDWNKSLLPGTINGEAQKGADSTVLFQYFTESNVRRFSVVPDGYSSSSMIRALTEQMPVPQLYDGLDIVESMNPKDLVKFMPRTAEAFENLGFHALGTSLYIGLNALDEGVAITDPSREQHCRLGLALWIHNHTTETTLDVPVVLGTGISSREVIGNYYPFVNKDQTSFVPTVKERLPRREPLYIHTGKLTLFDYVFLYPTEKDGNSWVAIIVDAKSTVQPEDDKMTVTGHDQANLFKAAVCLYEALREAGMSLTQVRLLYLTNRDRLAKSKTSELEECKAEAKKIFEGLDLEPLNRTSFEFPPFSDMLFSRRRG